MISIDLPTTQYLKPDSVYADETDAFKGKTKILEITKSRLEQIFFTITIF